MSDTPYVFQPWPSWRFGPKGESAVFHCEDDVPEGWKDSPAAFTEPEGAPPRSPAAFAEPEEDVPEGAPPRSRGRPKKAAEDEF